MSSINVSKTERIDVRASAPVKQLLQDAARAYHKSVSEFLLDAGVTAAAQTLADRRQFVLDEAGWAAFPEALDRQVAAKPRLKKLLREPGVLDRVTATRPFVNCLQRIRSMLSIVGRLH